MASADLLKTISLEAGSTVSPFRFVSFAADGQADHTGGDARADGVSVEGASVGLMFAASVMGGIAMVEAGGAISRGALVGSATAGKLKAAGTSANNYSLGVALEEAGGDGDIIAVLLHSPDRHGGT